MTRKARCLCEKDFLEKSLSPTKYCSLKYSKLHLRQAMAPADRLTEGEANLIPQMVSAVGTHPWGGQDTACSPFHKPRNESCLGQGTVTICYNSTPATSLVSAEEQHKIHTFPERELLEWRKNVYVCGFMTLETANLLDHSLANGIRGQ